MRGKFAVFLLALLSARSYASCDGVAGNLAQDAREDEDGSPVALLQTTAIVADAEYQVSVASDGNIPHAYRVTFPDGSCDARTARLCDLTAPDTTPTGCE